MTPSTANSTSPNRSASTRRPKASIWRSTPTTRRSAKPPPRASRSRSPISKAIAEHPLRDVVVEAGFHSVLVVPLVDQKGILGSLVVLRQNAGEFSDNLIGLMKTFAHQSVLAMRNARLFSEVDHKSRELEMANSTVREQADKLQEQTRPAQGLEQVAGGAGRDATGRNRTHPPPRTFPGAAGGAADRLRRRPGRPARQPAPRSHGRVLRHARLYLVHRDHRAGRGDERAARISRRVGRTDFQL